MALDRNLPLNHRFNVTRVGVKLMPSTPAAIVENTMVSDIALSSPTQRDGQWLIPAIQFSTAHGAAQSPKDKAKILPLFEPMVPFSANATLLQDGLLDLALFFTDKKNKNEVKTECNKLRKELIRLGGPDNGAVYSGQGGLLAMTALPWINVNDQQHFMYKLGIMYPKPGTKESQAYTRNFFLEPLILHFVQKYIQEKYKRNFENLVNIVYMLIEFNTLPANVREFGERMANPMLDVDKKLLIDGDYELNSLVALLQVQKNALMTTKISTSQLKELLTAVNRIDDDLMKTRSLWQVIKSGTQKQQIRAQQHEIDELKKELQTAAQVAAVTTQNKLEQLQMQVTTVSSNLQEQQQIAVMTQRNLSVALSQLTQANSEVLALREQLADLERKGQVAPKVARAEANASSQIGAASQVSLATLSSLSPVFTLVTAATVPVLLNQAYLNSVKTAVAKYRRMNPEKANTARRAAKLETQLALIDKAIALFNQSGYDAAFADLTTLVDLYKTRTTFRFVHWSRQGGIDTLLKEAFPSDASTSLPSRSTRQLR